MSDKEWQVLLHNDEHAEEAANTGQSLGNFIPKEVIEMKRRSVMENRVTFKRDSVDESEVSPNTHGGEAGDQRIDSLENEDSVEENNKKHNA